MNKIRLDEMIREGGQLATEQYRGSYVDLRDPSPQAMRCCAIGTAILYAADREADIPACDWYTRNINMGYKCTLDIVEDLTGLRLGYLMAEDPVIGDLYSLDEIIARLNDEHNWSFEEIADWIETLYEDGILQEN